jgi:hypothetical protein
MHRLAVIAATAAMLIADQSQAQTTDNLLRGLSKIKLVIERLEADDRVCGLTEEALRAAAMFPLSSAKVEVTPAAPAYLYVNLLTLYLAPVDLCVSNIQMQVLSYQSVTLDFSGEEKLAVVELWNGGSIYSSARANHLRRISEVIDGRTKKFLTDWNLDNRTRPRPPPLNPKRSQSQPFRWAPVLRLRRLAILSPTSTSYRIVRQSPSSRENVSSSERYLSETARPILP